MKKKDEVKECNENNRPLVSGPLRGSGLCALSPSPCATMQGFAGDVLSATPQLNFENGHAAGSLFPCSTTPSATADCRRARQYKRPQTDVINDTHRNSACSFAQVYKHRHVWISCEGSLHHLCKVAVRQYIETCNTRCKCVWYDVDFELKNCKIKINIKLHVWCSDFWFDLFPQNRAL